MLQQKTLVKSCFKSAPGLSDWLRENMHKFPWLRADLIPSNVQYCVDFAMLYCKASSFMRHKTKFCVPCCACCSEMFFKSVQAFSVHILFASLPIARNKICFDVFHARVFSSHLSWQPWQWLMKKKRNHPCDKSATGWRCQWCLSDLNSSRARLHFETQLGPSIFLVIWLMNY